MDGRSIQQGVNSGYSVAEEHGEHARAMGAFRYSETSKKFEFVPAKKVQIDGVWHVKISSYSNSVYVVADNAVSFTDMQRHWSKSDDSACTHTSFTTTR